MQLKASPAHRDAMFSPSDGARVLDWDGTEVGVLREVRVDPATRRSELLVVGLSRGAGPATEAEVLPIPIRFVFGFRSGEIHLDRSLGALRRALALAA